MTLYRIVLPYAVAGVEVADGIVRRAAPILRWTVGKRIEQVATWVRGKRGTCTEIAS